MVSTVMKLKLCAILAFVSWGQLSTAANEIRVNAPITEIYAQSWVSIGASESEWVDVGSPVCSNWIPDALSVDSGIAFTQTASDCSVTQQKTIQEREQNSVTFKTRDVGQPQVISQTNIVNRNRSAVGTAIGVWTPVASVATPWSKLGSPTQCSNWAPATSTVAQGVQFSQTATDCVQLYEQSVQAQEQNAISKVVRNVGAPVRAQQTMAATASRNAVGTSTSKVEVYSMRGYADGNNLIGDVLSSNTIVFINFYINFNNSRFQFNTSPVTRPGDITSLRWVMSDDAGVAQYTIVAPEINYVVGNYLGWVVTAEDRAMAKKYPNWTVTVVR